MDRLLAVAFAALVVAGGSAVPAQGSSSPRNDYTRDDAWLCRPGRQDACSQPLTSTVVRADAAPSIVTVERASDPPVDCFYVYPTVSTEPTPNADMTAGPEERTAARVQFAGFGPLCRLFAPIYRQTTLASLSGTVGADPVLAYGDVRDAWRDYLARDNHGRGVVLIGHSQGAQLLAELIAQDIEGKPAASLLVSAIIPGTVIGVPTGKDVGGTFKQTPLCRRTGQFGCVVAYSTFRAANPPPGDSYFGRSPGPGLSAACVNPAAPGGGRSALEVEMPVTPKAAADLHIATTFIALPGLVSGECVTDGDLSYLAVTVGSDSRAPLEERALAAADARPGWGLHALDLNIVLDDLVDLVGTQSAAWTAAQTSH